MFASDVRAACPQRIEVGPIYESAQVKTPRLREFVIDVDIDAFDAVRFCCAGAALCPRCVVLLRAGAVVLRHVLETHFGFRHVLCVFSGRRGVHLWVCDSAALALTEPVRRDVVRFLNIFEARDTVDTGDACDLFADAAAVLEPFMDEYLAQQDVLAHDERLAAAFGPRSPEQLRALRAARGWKDVAAALVAVPAD